jgi:selenocysteine lyase/cysteine desulfurase
MLHQTIGTGAEWGVRVSPGVYTTADEIEQFLTAIRAVAQTPAATNIV